MQRGSATSGAQWVLQTGGSMGVFRDGAGRGALAASQPSAAASLPLAPSPPLPSPPSTLYKLMKTVLPPIRVCAGPRRRLKEMNISWRLTDSCRGPVVGLARTSSQGRRQVEGGGEGEPRDPAMDPLGPICTDETLCSQLPSQRQQVMGFKRHGGQWQPGHPAPLGPAEAPPGPRRPLSPSPAVASLISQCQPIRPNELNSVFLTPPTHHPIKA